MTITAQDLPAILEAHRLWLRGEGGSRANLSRANLSGANLSRADLSGADLSRADLSGADLYRANLSGANLYGANLYRANLAGGNLSRANLAGANLAGADLAGAEWRDGIVINKAPVIIGGLHYRVYILDAHMQIGCELHRLCEWEAFDNERIARMDGVAARRFWDAHKDGLLAMARGAGRDFSAAPVMGAV